MPSQSSSHTDARRRVRVAVLVSTFTFEEYYEQEVGLSREAYLGQYRSDWSLEHAAALQRHGADVLVYFPTLRDAGVRPSAQGWNVRFLKLSRFWSAIEPFLPALMRTPPGRYLAEVTNTACFLRSLQAALDEDDIDVLYVQEYWPPRFHFLTRRLALPIVAVDQGSSTAHHLGLGKRRTLGRAARLLVQTTAERQRLAKLGVAGTMAPNFVDSDFFAPAREGPEPPREGRRLLTVAVLNDWKKRTSDLIRALQILPADWTLEVVGEGPDASSLLALARGLGVADRVEFTGFLLDRELLRDRYLACDVFSLPSTHEGLPLAVLEAMACAKPVVVSTFPAYDDLIQDGLTGFRVPLSRPDLLAGAILRAADDPSIGLRARTTIEQRHGVAAGRRLAELVVGAAADGSSDI